MSMKLFSPADWSRWKQLSAEEIQKMIEDYIQWAQHTRKGGKMSKFMLLIQDDIEAYSRYSREELTALIERMGRWARQLREAGIHQGAEKLTDEPGRVVTKTGITDGPFAE